jgi:hypothetical protein
MRCPSCGRDVSDQPFCEGCGKPLKAEKSAPIELKPVTQSADKPLSPVPSSAESGAAPHATPSARTKEKPETATSQPRWQGIVWTALAIVLYLAIADAAVETFLRDSPLRWWIAGAAALYLALCVAVWRLMPKLWRRLNWANQAAISLLVLLALMSATAWMPGGLEQGLNLVGQPTSIVLAVVSAVVVALSGIFLARLQFVPLAGKIVAGLLALYAVAAFLLAANAGTPYPSLFHGASQWTRLPSWLQGATVGGLFLVPLALLLEIVTCLRQFTRDRISDFAFRVVALGMSLVITVAAVRIPADTAMGSAGGSDSDAIETPPWLTESHEKPLPQGEAGYKVVSERLNRMYAALDVVNSKIDRSLFEIDALADRLGSDPAAIFHFVRDEIRYEPYVGVLRGPLGTLLCRAGNSLDRSLLLAALLQKAGLTTQIANGQLSSQQAQTLVSRLFEPVKPVPQAIPTMAELAPEIGRAMGVDQAKLLQFSDEMRQYGQKQRKQLMDYVDSESKYLSDLLSKAGVDAGVVTPNDQLVAEASQHYWVQYQNSNGQWVDLDSAFTDAEPGKANAQVTNTFAPDAVPEELYHHLRITLTLRVAQVAGGNDGPTTDTVLLDKELRVAEQQGKDIILANYPVPVPDMTKPGVSFADVLTKTKGYQTMLQVGSQSLPGKYFDLDGQISDNLGGPVGDVVTNAGGVGKGIGGIAGGMNGVFGGGSSEGNATRIVGEWAEYELASPTPLSRPLQVHQYRRYIVGAGPLRSTTGNNPETPQSVPSKDFLRQSLMWATELSPLTGTRATDYVAYLQLESLIAGRVNVEPILKRASGLDPAGSVKPVPRLPIRNLIFDTEAGRMTADVAQQRFSGLKSYFAQPGLVAYEISGGHSVGGMSFIEGYDIVAYAPRLAANAAATSEAPGKRTALFHLMQGVSGTRLEWELMAESGETLSGSSANILNATQVFATAQKSGVRILVLKPGASGVHQLASLSLSHDVKSELLEDLGAGQTLVLPSNAVDVNGSPQVAWWRLDNASGELIGVMPGERGDAMTEYLFVQVLSAGWCMYDALHRRSYALGAMCACGFILGFAGTAGEEPLLSIMGIIADQFNHVMTEQNN